MPIQVIGALNAATMSEVVEFRGKKHKFLKDLLFPSSTERVIGTSTVQVDNKTYNPSMAPFVRSTDTAVMIPRQSGGSYSIECPNISLKAPLQASDELLQRRAGQGQIFVGENENANFIRDAVEQDIMDDTMILLDQIEEREEWMVAQGLIGVMNYEVENREAFELTLAKPVSNTVIPAIFWDAANPKPHQDLQGIKTLQNVNNGPNITDGICSLSASQAISKMIEAEELKMDETRRVDVGGEFKAFANQYDEQGVIYLGRINGIDFWEYAQSVTEEDGTTIKLIREKYIEFVSRTAKARKTRRRPGYSG